MDMKKVLLWGIASVLLMASLFGLVAYRSGFDGQAIGFCMALAAMIGISAFVGACTGAAFLLQWRIAEFENEERHDG